MKEERGLSHLATPAPCPTPSPTDSLGFPTPVLTIPCPLPSSRLSPLLCLLGSLPQQGPQRPLDYGIMRGRCPSSWGIPARSVLSKHKHGPKDNTSADLVIGLWAGRREGAGCPLRWEDETRGPLCQQLLRHLFPPAFGGFPPPTLSSLVYPAVLAPAV